MFNKIIGLAIAMMPFVGMAYQNSSMMSCVNFANDISKPEALSTEQVGILCNGASNRTAPVLCFNEAWRLNLSAHNKAVLCSSAQNLKTFDPISCYKEVLKAVGRKNSIAAVTICSQASDMSPYRNCAKQIMKDPRQLEMDWGGAAALCTQGFMGQK